MQILVWCLVSGNQLNFGFLLPSSSREKFRTTPEAEARILLLIDAFSRDGEEQRTLEGRIKLAKLDFFLRYPKYLQRVLIIRKASNRSLRVNADAAQDESPIDARMMRYRYGPWDPAYYAILGSLIGRGLIDMIPLAGRNGFGYRTTSLGAIVAGNLADDESFEDIVQRARLLRQHLDLTGTYLKELVYKIPEVSSSSWREDIE